MYYIKQILIKNKDTARDLDYTEHWLKKKVNIDLIPLLWVVSSMKRNKLAHPVW